jgi:acyl-CoA synthetase
LTLLSPDLAAAYRAAGHWGDDTIYELARRWAEQDPTRTALVERDRVFSYADIVDAADRLAADWEERGIRPGQRIAAWQPSRAETVACLLACSRNRYVFSPSLHRDHTADDVATLLRRMRAVVVVAEQGYGADADSTSLVDRLAVEDGAPAVVMLPAGPDRSRVLFPGLRSRPASAPVPDPTSIVYLPFTSGTTGDPKGAMHSDCTLLSAATAMAADWSLGSDTVVYSLSPLSHNLGFGAMVMSLAIGGQLVVHDLPRGSSLLDRLRETHASFVFGVPTHAIDLLAELERRPTEQLAALKGFRISGAALPPGIAERLVNRGITPQAGFGMTEAGSHHYTRPDDDVRAILETVGRPFDGHEIRIVSEQDPDRELPVGEIGQIISRGPSLMLGYFDNQAATEEAFTAQGWFLTGDLGAVDEDGFLKVTGRQKDIIVRGGHNIFPAKLESLASRHPAVKAAAAIGVPDERLGERVCLVLSLMEDRPLQHDEILGHLAASGLSKYEMPEYLAVVDGMPVTGSGKILKRRVADDIRTGSLQPVRVRFVGPT